MRENITIKVNKWKWRLNYKIKMKIITESDETEMRVYSSWFRMEIRIKFMKFVLLCIILTFVSLMYVGYFCSNGSCFFFSPDLKLNYWLFNKRMINDDLYVPILQNNAINYKTPSVTYDDILNDSVHFDMNAHDVIVFLHIQKTGGTSFGRHLVRDLNLKKPCTCQRKRKRCYCYRPNNNENWLFSRYSTGWKCGLHADWTELTNCVDGELDKIEGESIKRRYYYITLLREPISRYLSEFKHVQRGATWRSSRHWCGGHIATSNELPKCYSGKYWRNVTLDEFLSCPYNLAVNRQTRMISDLSLIGCYNRSYMDAEEREKVMLASAKRNLASMAFFALTEYQKIGQYVFEETFNLRFAVPFMQNNTTRSSEFISMLRPDLLKKVYSVNALDTELYDFAKSLMFRRFEKLRSKDPQFDERWKHLGELPIKTEFNWDNEIELDESIYD